MVMRLGEMQSCSGTPCWVAMHRVVDGMRVCQVRVWAAHACPTRRVPARLTQFHRSDEALSRGSASLFDPALQLWGGQPTATRQPAPLTLAAVRNT